MKSDCLMCLSNLDPAFHTDRGFLCSLIRAEEMGTASLEIRIINCKICSFIMLWSFSWVSVGFSKRFVDVAGLVMKYTRVHSSNCEISCNILRENMPNPPKSPKQNKTEKRNLHLHPKKNQTSDI